MPTYDWDGGTSGDFALNANLNPSGTNPVANDTIRFQTAPTRAVDSNQDAWSAIKLHFIVGPNHNGALGSTGTPMTAAADSTLKFDGTNVPESYWNLASGAVVNVKNTSVNPNACVLQAGTYAKLLVARARSLTLGASATFTLSRLLGRTAQQDIVARIESGATVTAIEVNGALIDCYAAIVTAWLLGGTWKHLGATNFDITTLNLEAGMFIAKAHGMTVGTLEGRGGMFDARQLGHATLSAGVIRTGAIVDLRNEADNISKANLTQAGGQILGGTGTPTIEMSPVAA